MDKNNSQLTRKMESRSSTVNAMSFTPSPWRTKCRPISPLLGSYEEMNTNIIWSNRQNHKFSGISAWKIMVSYHYSE
jgi:hypothetical protein